MMTVAKCHLTDNEFVVDLLNRGNPLYISIAIIAGDKTACGEIPATQEVIEFLTKHLQRDEKAG